MNLNPKGEKMKSWRVHYQNKYPHGQVVEGDGSMDVYDAKGRHCVALRRNAHGQLVCVSEEMGCKDRHDLAPIPRDARVYKLHANGKIGLDEEHAEREALRAEYVRDGKVMSEAELQAEEKAKKLAESKARVEAKSREVSRDV